jgi:hypothetical protein
LLVIQFAAVVAVSQHLTVASESRKIVGDDGHVAGFDVFLAKIDGVLDDAVALVHVNHGRPLAAVQRNAEKAVDAIVDFDGDEHPMPFKVRLRLSSQDLL